MGKKILETSRLIIREAEIGDAPFFYELLNSRGWLDNIGDRNIHSLADAELFIVDKYLVSYSTNGFGFWVVCLKDDNRAIGMAGFAKRPHLEYADLGYAFLPDFQQKGFAREAAEAALKYGREDLKFEKIIAIVLANNSPSVNLLKKLGFVYDKAIVHDTGDELDQYVHHF